MSLLEDLDPSENYFDAAQGLYWYAADWHSGQSSELYGILSARLGYRPSPMESGPDADSVAADVYAALEAGTVEPTDVLAFVNAGYDATR